MSYVWALFHLAAAATAGWTWQGWYEGWRNKRRDR